MTKSKLFSISVLIALLLPTGLAGQQSIDSIQSSINKTVEQNINLPEKKTKQLQTSGVFEGYKSLNSSLPGEKVYLHLDRPNYMQGDTIWFKAYSWFGFDQIADTVSKVLYVNLINPDGKVELKKKLLIQNGTSVGEFSLDKNIPAGKYYIRAYTRWMQNENTGEPFYQSVTISALNQNFRVDCSPLIIKQADGDSLKVTFRFYEMDPAGDLRNDFNHKVSYSVRIGERRLETGEALAANTKEQVFKCRLPGIGEKDSVAIVNLSIKDERLTFDKQFRIPLKEELDLQFFPEGGSLVNGLESRVAFKVIGTDGLSREIKGVIKETGEGRPGTGDVITSFESRHKGMGDFLLKPQKDKKYTAWVEYNHRLFNFLLPAAYDEGLVMIVNNSDNRDTTYVRVKSSPSRKDERLYVTGSSYGRIRFITNIKTSPDSSIVSIPLEILPEGVSHITLLSGDFKPRCERLIYNERGERFKVEVKSDSSFYSLRSKVSLSIKTTDLDGNPVPANLSLSVVDKEQVVNNSTGGSISAFKLLETELKGYIEDPDYYFKGDTANQKALDLLLLTQGYRRFVTDRIKSKKIKYYPERSFDITGKVALRGNTKKIKNFNYSNLGLNLLCPSDNSYFDQTRPDSIGKFSFSMPIQYGRPLSLLRAYTATGKLSREKIPKEKSFMGDILLDEASPAPVFMPLASFPEIAWPAIDYVRQLQEAKKSELSKLTNGIKWQINLPEVTIKARSKDKEWYTHYEDEAKKIVDMDSIDPTGKKYMNVYDVLVKDFGARKCRYEDGQTETILLPCITMKGPNPYYPIYLLNGQIYCNEGENTEVTAGLLNMLSSIRVNEIKRLMVLPPGNITYHYADHGILFGDSIRQIFAERHFERPIPIKQSMVVIETYSRHTFYRGDPDGIKTFVLEGLDTPRVFYSPRYEGSSRQNPIYDGRATLYWNPAVRTNEKGEAKVEFYTGDRKTGMEIVINGIEIGNGFTGQGRTEINSNFKK